MFLSSTEPVGQNALTILYTVPLYGTDDARFFFLQNILQNFAITLTLSTENEQTIHLRTF